MILLTSEDLHHMCQVKVNNACDRTSRGQRLCVCQPLYVLFNKICKLV